MARFPISQHRRLQQMIAALPPLPAVPVPAPGLGGGFLLQAPAAPAPLPGAAHLKPTSLSPHPTAQLAGLIQQWPARLQAAQARFYDESVCFIAAVMQLWGDNVHHPIIPNGQATVLARCNWVYDEFVSANGPRACNIDHAIVAPLDQLRIGNQLTPSAFNAAFEFIVNLLIQNNNL